MSVDFNRIKKHYYASNDIDEKLEYLNKELKKTGIHEAMVTAKMYQGSTQVPNQDYINFNGLSQGGYALGLSGADGNSLGNATIGINPSTGQTGVALSPPHPVTGVKRVASTVLDGVGFNRALRPGIGTRVRGTNDDGSPRVINDGSAVWFFDSAYNSGEGRWLNFEYLDGELGFWDTNFLGFFFHNTNLDEYELGGVNIGTQIKNKIAGINFGANGEIGAPQTTVLVQNDLSDPGFLPINIKDLSKQAFDFLKDKAGRNRRGSGMRNRGREDANIPGADNQRGIGARINTGDPEMDRGLGQLFQRGSQALRGAIQSLSGTLRGIGGRSKGLGGAVELGFHGTSRSAARNIRGSGFRPGSRQNIFGTKGTFVAPSPRQTGGKNLIPQAARDFSRRGGSAGRGAVSRAFGSKSKTPGSILPVVTPTGSGVRSRIPGTKFAEVGVNQKTANRGLRLGQNIIKGKYPNSAKAKQLLNLGKTTNAAKGAKGLAKTAGRLAPGVGIALAGIDVAQRGNQARQNFKNGNFAAASLDIAGAGLGALTAIPGPVGWAALAGQAVLDLSRAKGVGNRIQGRVSRSNQNKAGKQPRSMFQGAFRGLGDTYELDGDILLEHELGGYLLVEQDDEDYTIDDEDKENLQGYMSLLVQELRKALPVVGDIDDEDEEFLQNLEAGEIGAPEDLEKIIKILEKLQSGGKDYDKKQVKESYITEDVGLGHFEPEVLNVNIDDLRKGIAPEFPKNPPPEMIDGYAANSRLAPKKIERDPFINITKKDLAKNHKLTDKEISDFMNDINMINDYIKKNPADLIYAQQRYPKHDPRLAQLNWQMDQMLDAGKEYVDKQFPENQKLFNIIKKKIKNTIDQTDPKNFKDIKLPKFDNTSVEDFKRKKEVYSRFMKKPVKTKKLFQKTKKRG